MTVLSREYFEASVNAIKTKMVDRLLEKSRHWGDSWREAPFEDHVVIERLHRAVDHLASSLALSADDLDQDVMKRAADVANLAMMAADSKRNRNQAISVPPEDVGAWEFRRTPEADA